MSSPMTGSCAWSTEGVKICATPGLHPMQNEDAHDREKNYN